MSWVLQMLGIFFLVGGYACVLSFHRRTGSTGAWLRGRIARLGRPVLGVTAVWALAAPVLYALGVPEATLRTGATLVIQPLWFVGVYVAVTALTPYCVRASHRLGGWAAVPLLASVAVVDALRYGPLAGSVPGWLSLLNIVPGWLFAYQLGVDWGEGRIGRRGAWALLVGGVALFATLLTVFHYPASMVGVPGAARTNSHPPSLLVPALAAAQSGAAMLVRDRLARLLSRPALWAPVVVVNLCAMTILCWHQSAMLAAAVPGSFVGELAGLTTSPTAPGGSRPGWPGCRCSRRCWWASPATPAASRSRGPGRRRSAGPWRAYWRRGSRCSPWAWREGGARTVRRWRRRRSRRRPGCRRP